MRHCASRSLERQPGERAELVARVFEHVAQHGLQLARSLREHRAELGQQPTDAIDAGGAVLLDAFAQPVHAQHALLLDGLDGDKAHRRPRRRLADRRGVAGVVLAARALAAVGLDQLRPDDACVQTKRHELPRPVVRARAGLHGDDAAGGQTNAPLDEPGSRYGAAGQHTTACVHGMNLDHALGQVYPYTNGSFSDNLVHGLPLSMATD